MFPFLNELKGDRRFKYRSYARHTKQNSDPANVAAIKNEYPALQSSSVFASKYVCHTNATKHISMTDFAQMSPDDVCQIVVCLTSNES